MRLKLIRAAGMNEAIARVRAELGTDALILATRRVADGVEITAALDPEEDAWPSAPAADAPRGEPGLAEALAWHGVPARLHPALLADPLEVALPEVLRFAALPLHAGDRPLLFAGPPGAGKTLTVARLATRLVMAGTVPVVVSADGRRAGGAEQLAAFTRLLGIDLLMAGHPVALSQIFGGRAGAAAGPCPALIDAPGCNPFDPAQLEELAAMASTADAEIVLVLPAGLHPDEAADLAAGFASLGTVLMVATRLDQARRLGGIVAATDAGGLALTEAGIGPGAADGLAAFTPELLAARLRTVADPPAGLLHGPAGALGAPLGAPLAAPPPQQPEPFAPPPFAPPAPLAMRAAAPRPVPPWPRMAAPSRGPDA
ncbi:MAG: hypothetical protein JSR21_01080 [Proteobacteria bacterium]|nr:hypothetical protein [Pseudomonadota bacterium]